MKPSGEAIIGVVLIVVALAWIIFVDSRSQRSTIDANNIEIAKYRKDSIQSAQKRMEDSLFAMLPAKKIQIKHPDWSNDDCRKLQEKQIWIGMDIEMVKFLCGNKFKVNVSNAGYGNDYQYHWDGKTVENFYCKSDGIVYAYN